MSESQKNKHKNSLKIPGENPGILLFLTSIRHKHTSKTLLAVSSDARAAPWGWGTFWLDLLQPKSGEKLDPSTL
ncbi:hypothetical protein IPL68_04525 [Candidatus Saccharibacteria bacterium]|nr:MAG: hypothetical protein IPL68_04525 [Candidatus Saccharibacteria bacterium]